MTIEDETPGHSGVAHPPMEVLRHLARIRRVLMRMRPAKLLLFGYLSYTLFGWALLCLPIAQAVPIGALDTLFIASSAVSTTGLVSVDPGTSFTVFGEVVILALIQFGGLGYMTIGSVLLLLFRERLGRMRRETIREEFSLPEGFSVPRFLVGIVTFTLIVEAAGAAVLWAAFRAEGIEAPLWSAVFHAVSAFCTAGFSLMATGFEGLRTASAITLTLSVLSILGAIGFLIVVDLWRNLLGREQHLGFTSKVVLRMTFWMIAIATALIFLADGSMAELAAWDRLETAFFQAMTAATTVGFNTWPVGGMAPAALVVLMFLMIFGASPAGTGGGLKTTTLAALIGLVRSTLKGRDGVRFAKRTVPPDRLQRAAAGLTYYIALLFVSLFILSLTEAGTAFEALMFEAISAMGTVGLSMGVTAGLSPIGKLVVIVLMLAGRVGILTFGIAMAAHDESREEEADNNLVC